VCVCSDVHEELYDCGHMKMLCECVAYTSTLYE
jgi:hypothetical protein